MIYNLFICFNISFYTYKYVRPEGGYIRSQETIENKCLRLDRAVRIVKVNVVAGVVSRIVLQNSELIGGKC